MASIQSTVIRYLIKRSGMWNKPLCEIRKAMENMPDKSHIDGVETKKLAVNGVACEEFHPPESDGRDALVYLHGGGFCLGVYPETRKFVAGLAKKCQIPAYLPDYRIAPEAPYPAALEDAVAFYKGILQKVEDSRKIILMGDSSGCALAVSALLVLKESGVAMPNAIVCITPVFDLAGRGDSFSTRAERDPFALEDPLGIAKIYIGTNNPTSPMLSPLYGGLGGLPPMMICAGEDDVFLSDALRFAEKAEQAQVMIKLKVWKQMWHLFPMQEALVPESRRALNEIVSYIHERTTTVVHR